MIIDDIFSSFNVAKWNLGQINLEPMRPAVSMICGVAATACLALCLHVSSGHHNCSCLLHRRSQDFSKRRSHCVKVRVLVCLDSFQAETSWHFCHHF